MQCYLIRHEATIGNREGRYVGRTDEPVLLEGLERLRRLGEALPPMDHVFTSPLLRCCQSGEALFFPKGIAKEELAQTMQVVPEFREMEFGEFEYKNYQELDGNPDYQRFIDSGGATAFPGGEDPQGFRARCRRGFEACIAQAVDQGWEHVGFSLHGGTIMALMEAWGKPELGYFGYQVKNGSGYQVQVCWESTLQLRIIREIG